jgi:acetyl-CoA carboxylase biotin carboxyl carrier protein
MAQSTMTRFKIELHDKESEVEVSRQGAALRVTRDGNTADLQLIHQDGVPLERAFLAFVVEWVLPNGQRRHIRAAGYCNGEQRQMWVNGRTFSYRRVRQRGSGAALDGSLSSSIPAVVSDILVKIGDAVAVGDKLILLESMKMVIPIQAPCDSTVTAIHCTPGESVQAGVPLLELLERAF